MTHFFKLSKSIFFVLVMGISCDAYAQKNNSKLYIIGFDKLYKEKNSITNKKHWKHQQINSTKHSEETWISDLKYIQKHFGDTTFDAVLHELHHKNNDKD